MGFTHYIVREFPDWQSSRDSIQAPEFFHELLLTHCVDLALYHIIIMVGTLAWCRLLIKRRGSDNITVHL